jgi:hypothetical protein
VLSQPRRHVAARGNLATTAFPDIRCGARAVPPADDLIDDLRRRGSWRPVRRPRGFLIFVSCSELNLEILAFSLV